MKRDYRKWQSPALGRDMEMLVFGEGGTPVLVFPTSMGRFYQWEDFGMIAHMAPRIDAGWLQLWCVDSVDSESFYDKTKAPQQRAARHVAYEKYLVEEVLPAIRDENPVDYLDPRRSVFRSVPCAVVRDPPAGHRAQGDRSLRRVRRGALAGRLA